MPSSVYRTDRIRLSVFDVRHGLRRMHHNSLDGYKESWQQTVLFRRRYTTSGHVRRCSLPRGRFRQAVIGISSSLRRGRRCRKGRVLGVNRRCHPLDPGFNLQVFYRFRDFHSTHSYRFCKFAFRIVLHPVKCRSCRLFNKRTSASGDAPQRLFRLHPRAVFYGRSMFTAKSGGFL